MTPWQPLPFPLDVKAALDEFTSWGAVVDHVLFAAPDVVDGAAHEMAAKSGLLSVVEKLREEVPLWDLTVNLATVDATRAEQITPQTFFGISFNLSSRNFQVPNGDIINFFMPHSPFDCNLTNSGAFSTFHSSVENPNGKAPNYPYTLLAPPHGLARRWPQVKKLTSKEVVTQFSALCDALFGDPKTLEILDWPTDCSNYFEPGLEWWGSSFWTVYAPSKKWIVAILASSTD